MNLEPAFPGSAVREQGGNIWGNHRNLCAQIRKNVKVIGDLFDSDPGNVGNRDMTYDALDRLTETDSLMFGPSGADKAIYTYDVLDDLLSASVGRIKAGAAGRLRVNHAPVVISVSVVARI